MYLGDFTPGKTVTGKFNTHQATGAPITLAGTPALSVYKDSTTESTSGVTLSVDYDSRTGMHRFSIDTSADGTFYAAGNNFEVVITAGTVDSVSVVGTVVGSFSLSNRSALRPTTADRTLDVSAGGEAGVDWANVGSPTTTLNLSGTTVKTATDVETDTQDIQGRLPAALVSGRMDSNVQAMANNVVTAAAVADGAIDRAAFAADTGLQSVRSNTAQAGGATSITLDASASGTTDYYKYQLIYLTGGTGAGQTRLCTAYNGTTKVATTTPAWATNPDNTTTFAVLATGISDVEAIKGTASAGAAGYVGPDWSAVNAPTTSLNLSGTTISTSQAVASVSGNVGGNVSGSVGSVTGNVGGNVSGSVGSVAAGGITAASIADGAIDAATFAADVDAEILSYLVDDATRIDASALNTLSGHDPGETIAGATGTLAANLIEINGTSVAGTGTRVADSFVTLLNVASPVLTVASVNQTGDSYARLGAPAGASLSADVAAVKTDTGNLVSRITSSLFSGITSLAQWLGLLAGKQTGNSTARTELRATGAGSGTYDETTDSLEAVRDRGDAAWATATGFSTHTAADVWAAGTRTLTAFSFSVTVGTNNDKTGYSLSQSFPANFADLAITASTGRVTVGTNADKTGYSISGTKTTLDALNDITAAAVWAVGARTLTAFSFTPSVNVTQINGVTLDGAGTEADPWGPA